ncbi:MAG TPA: hypothetical protein VM687_09615 [Stenotrophomonas sp.]|nr:hypothetical protein [Stenotrophomonas sp.]
MKVISEQQASEILVGHGLAFGSWKQVSAPAHLSASVTPSRDYRSTWLATSAVIDWLGAEDWLLCSFDLSNAVLEGEAEAVSQATGCSIRITGDQPILFEKSDVGDTGQLKRFASAMLGFEWHCYFVAKGRYGVRCAAFLDGVVDFVHGDQASAKRLADKISQY